MDICTFESGEEIGYFHFYLCRSYVPFSEIVCKGHFLVESKCKYGIFFPDQTFHKIFYFGLFIPSLLSWCFSRGRFGFFTHATDQGISGFNLLPSFDSFLKAHLKTCIRKVLKNLGHLLCSFSISPSSSLTICAPQRA